MPHFSTIPGGGITTPGGFRASGVAAGLKESGDLDVALVVSESPAAVAGMFTTNAVVAAPVVWCRDRLRAGTPVRALVVNSGNANAWTGRQGRVDTAATAECAATLLGCSPEEVLVCSTGRIGVPLPMRRLQDGIAMAAGELSRQGGGDAARAIMTTDTVPKSLAVRCDVGDAEVCIGGMAKGAGMIAPQLVGIDRPPQATMLAYLTTDAAVEPGFLQACLEDAVEASFNRLTVDGDRSTNDTVLILANGTAGTTPLTADSPGADAFRAALRHANAWLAKQLVLDGEGVTHVVELHVSGARSVCEARKCAETIANSLLCKTAWFGGDPNWGRILAAAGYAGVAIVEENVALDYGGVPVVRGGVDAGTPEEEQARPMQEPEFRIDLDLGAGVEEFTIWTCDLSYEYVKINAEYRT